jgi:hypothetical protein
MNAGGEVEISAGDVAMVDMYTGTRQAPQPSASHRSSTVLAYVGTEMEKPTLARAPPSPPPPRRYGGGGDDGGSSLRKLDPEETSELLRDWIPHSRIYRMTDRPALAKAHAELLNRLENIQDFNISRHSRSNNFVMEMLMAASLARSTMQTLCIALVDDFKGMTTTNDAIKQKKILALATVAVVQPNPGPFETPGFTVHNIAISPTEVNNEGSITNSTANLSIRMALRLLAEKLELPLDMSPCDSYDECDLPDLG